MTAYDPDFLLDAIQVAELVGWQSGRAVSQYRTRHPNGFPAPVIDRGRCMLWHRYDIEAWIRDRR